MLIRSVILLGCVAATLMLGGCRHTRPDAEPRSVRADSAAGETGEAEADAGVEEPREERWVTQGAVAGGDGTREKPHGSIEEALASAEGRALHLRLEAGTYVGTWELPAGTLLEGDVSPPSEGTPASGGGFDPTSRRFGFSGGTILKAPEDHAGPLIRAEGAIALKHLHLEGGSPTLDGPGPWNIEAVALKAGSSCLAMQGGTLNAWNVLLEGTQEGGTCLQFGGDAEVELVGTFIRGPWHEGLAISDSAKVKGWVMDVTGPTWPIRQRGGVLFLEVVGVQGAGEAGIYVAGGALALQYVGVEGYDYGLMAGQGGVVEGADVELAGAKRAGLAMVGAQVELNGVKVTGVKGEGAFAGVQMVGGSADLTNVQIKDVAAAGVSQRDGVLFLRGMEIRDVAASADGSEGAGVSVRMGTAHLLDRIRISGAGGPGVLVAESGKLKAREVNIWEAGWAGAVVETGGSLEVEKLVVRGTPFPALLVTENASARITRLHIPPPGYGVEVPSTGAEAIVAECDEGAQIQLSYFEGATRPSLPCLR